MMDLRPMIRFVNALEEHRANVRRGLPHEVADSALRVASLWGAVQGDARSSDDAARELYAQYVAWVVRASRPGLRVGERIEDEERVAYTTLISLAAKRLVARLIELSDERDTEAPAPEQSL